MCSNDLFIFLHYVFHMKYYSFVITYAPKADKRDYTYAMPHDLPLISMYMNRYEFLIYKVWNICHVSLFAVHAIRKPIPSHDATNRKEAQVESTSSDDDTFEDVMVNPPSNHSNILDALFESSYRDNRTIEPFRGTSKMYKTEPNSIPQNGTSPYDDHDERNEATTNDSSSANMTTGTILFPFFFNNRKEKKYGRKKSTEMFA